MNELNTNNWKSDVENSRLYSEDLAPIPIHERTWSLGDMTAIWIGMAVCIPTYLLASYMIKSGLSWVEALVIILLGNLIITIPLVLNGHAGVKYGVPFPVIGRASFGNRGIHIAAVIRGIVACGWFGIQTWIGGLAFYAIWHAIRGTDPSLNLDAGKFMGFALFWLMNVYFIWKGTESIKWLEKFAAPILIAIGIILIAWGSKTTGSFTEVLRQSSQLAGSSATLDYTDQENPILILSPLSDKNGKLKATHFKLFTTNPASEEHTGWLPLEDQISIPLSKIWVGTTEIFNQNNFDHLSIQYKSALTESSIVPVVSIYNKFTFWNRIWSYLLWLTAMVGFWATMAISIADITRFTKTQRNQIMGQFLGLPGTMLMFSFVGIFVTCAAAINFSDILISDDAPWDPVTLIGNFENPIVVIIAQVFMIIATLSTNIAANVIAPANAFSNLIPTRISFRTGGIITAVIGIIISPWWLLDEISNLLIFVSSFLGPVLGILICDYFLIRNKELNITELFREGGESSFGGSGYNKAAMIALASGIVTALIGLWIPLLSFLYTLSWFSGFLIAFVVYYFLMSNQASNLVSKGG